ncbi:DUF3880 domain-containing protein [Xylanibacillus composti]|uniref:DUF3880 domain-containing protein n=1 Tax=Xylanibacillus composti TaxID=1572762 RepID=UPI004032D8BD
MDQFRLPHIYWSVEDPLYTDSIVMAIIETSKPDFIFTICKSMVEYYRSFGFPCAHLDWGINL